MLSILLDLRKERSLLCDLTLHVLYGERSDRVTADGAQNLPYSVSYFSLLLHCDGMHRMTGL